jgi:hypothetical protein
MALITSPGHAGEGEQARHVELGQRSDDVVHVAAGAEIAALAAQHHGLDVVGIGQIAEQVAQFGVGLEGQRVLAFGTVEADQRHAAFHAIAEVARLVGLEFCRLPGSSWGLPGRCFICFSSHDFATGDGD